MLTIVGDQYLYYDSSWRSISHLDQIYQYLLFHLNLYCFSNTFRSLFIIRTRCFSCPGLRVLLVLFVLVLAVLLPVLFRGLLWLLLLAVLLQLVSNHAVASVRLSYSWPYILPACVLFSLCCTVLDRIHTAFLHAFSLCYLFLKFETYSVSLSHGDMLLYSYLCLLHYYHWCSAGSPWYRYYRRWVECPKERLHGFTF